MNQNIIQKHASETRVFAHCFREKMTGTEILSGTPTVAELGTADLTIENVGLLAIDTMMQQSGLTYKASESVTFTISGGTTRNEYTLRITTTTDADQTLVDDIRLSIL